MFPSIESFFEGKEKIVVVGLGYVGLPLAVCFASRFNVIGFDINPVRIDELNKGIDRTGEIESLELKNVTINFTNNPMAIAEGKIVIVTVPTPITSHNTPDLTPVVKASETVGKYMTPGSVVVYESTVYPGVTEDICIPILEKHSGLTAGIDFKVGYSPERVNPGDKEHTVPKIKKVVSGQDEQSTEILASIYGEVISAGIHIAPNIKTAESAKVIENIQRDLNIALVNELALIFNRMGIDTREVLEAAATKWNFIKYEPGLVGGHCIGVDPYYLTYKAEEIGYRPDVILAGRRTNDGIGKYIAEQTVKKLIEAGKAVKGSRVLILGFTFKEDIPDIRNTRVVDIYHELSEYGIKVDLYDPMADIEEVLKEYGLRLKSPIDNEHEYDGIIIAVKHQKIKELGLNNIVRLCNMPAALIDVKGIENGVKAADMGFIYWRL